jgi:hypothetical protein
VIARAFEGAGALQHAFIDEILEVPRGRRAGSAGDGNVILRTQSTFEALQPFAEDPRDGFFLALVELTFVPVIEFHFLDQKVDHALRCILRLQNGVRKIHERFRDFVVAAAALERLVISLPVSLDGLRERDERRLAECLGERFFRKRARNPAVAVFKRS